MKSFLATPKLAVDGNADCRGAGIVIYSDSFRNDENPERILGIVPINGFSGTQCAICAQGFV